MTTQDSDISVLMDPPAKSSERDIALSLQARLSHLLSSILQSMYHRLDKDYELIFSKLSIRRKRHSSVHS